MMKRSAIYCCLSLILPCTAFADAAAESKIWMEPDTALREDEDFGIQGEYGSANAKVGVQVLAMGEGRFDGYLLEGGLPGLGWISGKNRIHLQGAREGKNVVMSDAGKKISATIRNKEMVLKVEDGATHKLPRIERSSITLGAKAPEGAVVLFDGTSTDHWENGKMENGFLLSTGCTSKRGFGSYKLHLEFRTPYKPMARGQMRGNSGVYHSGRWETQILDSFGLEGKDNECGGIYSISKPRLNMCLPPLAWQTYDVEFTAAKFDASGKRTAWPRITVRLNGVVVHEDLELSKDFTTSAPISKPLDGPDGPIFLQAHGNPVVYRNIWIVPEGSGTMFDNTMLFYFPDSGESHHSHGVEFPFVVMAGKNSKLNLGRRYIRLPFWGTEGHKTLGNWYTTLLNLHGNPIKHFGDPDTTLRGDQFGPIKEFLM